jgi:hypothetical protein
VEIEAVASSEARLHHISRHRARDNPALLQLAPAHGPFCCSRLSDPLERADHHSLLSVVTAEYIDLFYLLISSLAGMQMATGREGSVVFPHNTSSLFAVSPFINISWVAGHLCRPADTFQHTVTNYIDISILFNSSREFWYSLLKSGAILEN